MQGFTKGKGGGGRGGGVACVKKGRGSRNSGTREC